jgi:hypothetical protein
MTQEEFHLQFVGMMDKHDLSEKELSSRLGISRTTVARYRLGTAAPHPLMMPSVFKAIEAIVAEKTAPCQEVCCTQKTNCAKCGELKHTPLRRDEMGGYVCLSCIDDQLDYMATIVYYGRCHLTSLSNELKGRSGTEYQSAGAVIEHIVKSALL